MFGVPMCAHRNPGADLGDPPSVGGLTWAVVLLAAALTWLVATLALVGATSWPAVAILPLTLVFGVLVGVVSRALTAGPRGGWAGVAGRAAVAVAVGVVVGELTATAVFSGSIDRRLDDEAARAADAAPAVVAATAELQSARSQRGGLDQAVQRARENRDQALVVARCEYHPTPGCPQTRITGDPGHGPQTRTANDFLAEAQADLDAALAERNRRAAALDDQIAADEHELAQARQAARSQADSGLGARWVAMNGYTLANAGALTLRVLADAFFALLILFPLILRLWRGETSSDRSAAAQAVAERAELAADTSIAVKRAEVRAAAENLWADQQLTRARLAAEAQTQIDREQERRRVVEALEPAVQAPLRTESLRPGRPVGEDVFLPIAAEAEAASLAAAASPPPRHLPQRSEPGDITPQAESGARPLVPSIPDVTRAAARWFRPFVPPIVARALDTTAQPLRSAWQMFEETEEIHFSLKRTRKVTVYSEESGDRQQPSGPPPTAPSEPPRWVDSTVSVERASLSERDSARGLRGADGPRQLPPGSD